MGSTISVTELQPGLGWGARVNGLGWDNIHDGETRAELVRLFDERGLIVFENMEPSSKMQVEVSKIFGPIKDHPTKSVPRSDEALEPGVIDMHHNPANVPANRHGTVEKDGRFLISYLPWHFDHTYNDELNRAGVLRAIIQAPEGGRTGFCDGIQLYQDFDPELRAKVEQLNGIYTLDVRLSQMKYGKDFVTHGDLAYMASTVEEARRFPRAIHPMVWQRPSGEKVIHLCGFSAVGIEGMENPVGDALFDAAVHEVNRKARAYWHEWKPTDMLIWDNHRMLHAVEGCESHHERRMHRTTIKGDYGLGRFEGGKKIGEVNREVAPMDLPVEA